MHDCSIEISDMASCLSCYIYLVFFDYVNVCILAASKKQTASIHSAYFMKAVMDNNSCSARNWYLNEVYSAFHKMFLQELDSLN